MLFGSYEHPFGLLVLLVLAIVRVRAYRRAHAVGQLGWLLL